MVGWLRNALAEGAYVNSSHKVTHIPRYHLSSSKFQLKAFNLPTMHALEWDRILQKLHKFSLF